MAVCKLCNHSYKVITNTHLRAAHGQSIHDYTSRFGIRGVGFPVNTMKLAHSDPRWQAWKHSLKGRKTGWSKGLTKETDLRVAKISKTMKRKRLDNFATWREKQKNLGIIPKQYSPFKKNGDLAELIGVTLGDGHIEKFPRTERIMIFSNANNLGFVERYARLLETIFGKKTWRRKVKDANCIRISLYQKNISRRLGIPAGNRRHIIFKVPRWIWTNRQNLIRFLRGLYEAEGSFCVHKPTSTYKFLFANYNASLLDLVFDSLQKLGFHPHRGGHQIQLSRKAEVIACMKLLQFRDYDTVDSA